MNNKQLDMVLGYLNEGTDIDRNEYLIESIDDFLNQIMYESEMITSLLEEDNNEEKDDNKDTNNIGLGTKIKETIKRFLNWLKKIITNIQLRINQLTTKLSSSVIKNQIDSCIKRAKNTDLKEIAISPIAYTHINNLANFDLKSAVEGQQNVIKAISTLQKDTFTNLEEAKAYAESMNIPVKDVIENIKNTEKDTQQFINVSVSEFVSLLEKIKGKLNDNFANSLKETIKYYNELYKTLASVKNADPRCTNIVLSSTTKAIRQGMKVSSFMTKYLISLLASINKVFKDNKKESDNK